MSDRPSDQSALALYNLTNAIQPALRTWRQAANAAMEDAGVGFSLGAALIVVARNPQGVTQGILAEQTGVNPGAVVRMLDQGEAAGLIERRIVASDRRAKTVHVTPAGAALARSMEIQLGQLRSALLGDLTIADILTATRVLQVIEKRSAAYMQDGADE